MKLINKLRNYIEDNEFRITILPNKVDIINYEKIYEIENDYIIVKYEKGLITVRGKNLVISKLMNDEVLITGIISNIELR